MALRVFRNKDLFKHITSFQNGCKWISSIEYMSLYGDVDIDITKSLYDCPKDDIDWTSFYGILDIQKWLYDCPEDDIDWTSFY